MMVLTNSVGGVFVLQRFFTGNADNIKIVTKLISSVVICILTLTFLFSISAVIISKTDFSYQILPTLTAVILGIAAVLDGFVISKISKENGLFWGIFAGILILITVISASLLQKTFNVNTNLIIKSIITIIAGAIGGIAGVNSN